MVLYKQRYYQNLRHEINALLNQAHQKLSGDPTVKQFRFGGYTENIPPMPLGDMFDLIVKCASFCHSPDQHDTRKLILDAVKTIK